MKNLTIKTKLLIGFISMVILISITGSFGHYGMMNIEKNSEKIYSQNLQDIDKIHFVKENLSEEISLVEGALIDKDLSKTKEALGIIETIKSENIEYIDSYGQSTMTADTKKVFNDFTTNVDKYSTIQDEMFVLLKNENYTEAINKKTELIKSRDDMFEKLNELIKINQDLAKKANDSNAADYSTTITIMRIILGLGIILAITMGTILSLRISKTVKKGLLFAEALGNGDLTYSVNSNSNDELGMLIRALNNAKEKMRNVMQNVIDQAERLTSSSEELSATLEEMSTNFQNIDENTAGIVKNISGVNEITEELSSTMGEVNSGITELAIRSTESSQQSIDIKDRAATVKENGSNSKKVADKLYEEKQNSILKSIEQGKVVNEIGIIAESIASIAEQTNLLALNANIEAANAGEHGRGFAIVANEVRVLAEQSSDYVRNIKDVVSNVQAAFDNLASNSKDILYYIDNSVKKDYDLLTDTGEKYEKDAVFISDLSQNVASMAEELNASTEQISVVVKTLSENMNSTKNNSQEILVGIEETNKAMEQVAIVAQDQSEAAEKLTGLVLNFKI